MGVGNVGGVIGIDETFFRESFKGNIREAKFFTIFAD